MKLQMICSELHRDVGLGDETLAEDIILRPTLQKNTISNSTVEDSEVSIPNGQLRLHIDNKKSFGVYKKGFTYTVDITEQDMKQQPKEVQEFLKEKK